jgi:anti-sigma regulatory factor (Ser/Thr protein kinase)
MGSVIDAQDTRHTLHVAVPDATHVGAARRAALAFAERVGLDETTRGAVGVVVSEAATNLAKHAGKGAILLRAPGDDEGGGFEMIAIDRGPGIPDVAGALRDGYSTTGTPGHGLGAMQRMASQFDIYSRRGAGTVVFARIGTKHGRLTPAVPVELGVVCLPKPGEAIAGDDWATMPVAGGGISLIVADGLGHGPQAADASRAAIDAFRETGGTRAPLERLQAAHLRLRPTRGAAVAIAEIDTAGSVRYAGVGNIAGSLVTGTTSQSMVSHNGIVGHEMRKSQTFTYQAPLGGLVVLHSDGLATQWRLDAYPGLHVRHPALVAAVLFRDFCRGRDDVTVLVVRAGALPA